MASVVASVVAEVPKPVFLMDVAGASASAGTKTVASASHLSGTGGAAPRSSSDNIKDSTSVVKDSTGVKDSTVVKDSTSIKDSTVVKDSTGEATADRTRGRYRYIPLPKLFATRDVLDQFPEAAMQDLLQALALAEDVSGGGGAAGFVAPRGGRFWVSKEDADVVQLKMAMPGLGKEHVKMAVEKGVLVVKGEAGDEDSEGGDGDKGQPRYSFSVGLSSQAFKLDQIKAEMKNGVLVVTVPKTKDEERKDVFEIKVE